MAVVAQVLDRTRMIEQNLAKPKSSMGIWIAHLHNNLRMARGEGRDRWSWSVFALDEENGEIVNGLRLTELGA
jgi:hypothetical protein